MDVADSAVGQNGHTFPLSQELDLGPNSGDRDLHAGRDGRIAATARGVEYFWDRLPQ